MKVQEIMTSLVVKLYPEDTIHEAAMRLAQNDISGAPVVDAGKVVGIVSEADLLRTAIAPAKAAGGHTMSLVSSLLLGQGQKPLPGSKVRSVMSEYVITVAPLATVWEAALVMERHGVKRLPVTDEENNLLGVISRADLVGVLARSDAELPEDVLGSISAVGDMSRP